MPSKMVIMNEITEELSKVQYVDFDKVHQMSEDVLFDQNSEFFFPNLKNTVVFVAGLDTWHKIKDLHDKGLIHIGLRNFNFTLVVSMPYVTLANNVKLVCSYGYVQGQPDWSKIELFRDSKFDKPIPKIDSWEIVELPDVGKALEKLETLNAKGEYYGFDFETRGFPLREGFKPLGCSIVGSKYGFYVNLRNYTDWQGSSYDVLRKFVESNYKRLVTYNCKFEISVIEHMWGEKLRFPDAMVLLLCDDYRPNRRTVPGLKPCAQKFLGVPSWDDDLEFEQKYFGNMCWRFKTPQEYLSELPKNEEYEISKSVTVNIKDALTGIMSETIERYCLDKGIEDPQEVSRVSKFIKGEYKDRILNSWGNEWEVSDPYTLGKYCIYDSFYTKLLWDYFKDKYPRAEEIYHGNFHYGAFLEDTAIPVNRSRLDTLKHYVEMTKINSGIFLVKFYLKCLEDTIGDYVDKELTLTPYTKKIISDLPWCMNMEPAKVLKEILKYSSSSGLDPKVTPIDKVDWGKFKSYASLTVARHVWEMVKNDSDIASACRKHRKAWIELGNEFNEASKYRGLILKINKRNLGICGPYFDKFNKEVEDIISPFDPKTCKLVCDYFEKDDLKMKPWKVMTDHPEVSQDCFKTIQSIQKEWNDDYWKQNYLGGRTFKKIYSYIEDSDRERWENSYNIFNAIPPIVLLNLPVDRMVSAEEVSDLIHLRELKPVLDLWDNRKLDQTDLPEGITKDYAKWLSEKLVQWSSEDSSRVVVFSIVKKYGWLCSAITQFWNWWWSADHESKHDLEVLDYSIRDARENKDSWYVDFQEYFYGASKQIKKDERAVDIAGFCTRFGFERSEIRNWRWINLTKDSVLNIEVNEDKLLEDWDNLYKFIHCWEFYSAATKQLSPYLTRMDEDSGTVVGTTRDGCEIIKEGVRGEKFLTHFNICGVVTKRTSGFFHTINRLVA